MTIKTALDSAKSLRQSPRAALECEILLAGILGKDRVFLHTFDDTEISQADFDALIAQVARLNENYPIEYLTHKVGFYSQEFFIAEGALIPRPETEMLVDKAVEMITRFKIPQVFEIGVGSGVIAIMIALLCPSVRIVATDISPNAIEIAHENIAQKSALDATLTHRISLIKTNLLDGIPRGENDFIISNPPYIARNDEIPPNLAYEPQMALFGGENGDEILRQIIALNPRYLALEIGYNQSYLAESLGAYESVEIYKDYANLPRGIIAWRG